MDTTKENNVISHQRQSDTKNKPSRKTKMNKKERMKNDVLRISGELSRYVEENAESEEFKERKRELINRFFDKGTIKLTLSFDEDMGAQDLPFNDIFLESRSCSRWTWENRIRTRFDTGDRLPSFIKIIDFINYILPISHLIPFIEKEIEIYNEKDRDKMRSELFYALNELLPSKKMHLIDSNGNIVDRDDLDEDEYDDYEYSYVLSEFEEEVRREIEKLALDKAKLYLE